MTASKVFEDDLLDTIFNNGVTPEFASGSLDVSLHTGNPPKPKNTKATAWKDLVVTDKNVEEALITIQADVAKDIEVGDIITLSNEGGKGDELKYTVQTIRFNVNGNDATAQLTLHAVDPIVHDDYEGEECSLDIDRELGIE